MALKNQKNYVKYQGRDDIVCNYGIRDDGKQFYYLDVNGGVVPFKNGNRIATTALVEAVDPMVKASNVGLIDAEGNEVIPFTNRSIRPVNDDIIIVEPASPTTQSVVEAIQLKSDPLSATKLVSTPATIKDKLNSKVGSEGRYLFNDQFSEATVCDIDGNNLVNGESYSFIVSNGRELYFSKNTVDSDITSYSIMSPEVQSDVASTNTGEVIDVTNVNVPQNIVEDALNNGVQVESLATENDAVPVEEKVDETVSPTEEILDEGQKVESLAPSSTDDLSQEKTSVEVAPADEETVQENVAEEVVQEDSSNNMMAAVSSGVDVPVDNAVADNNVDSAISALGEEVQNSAKEDTVVPSEVVNNEPVGDVTEEAVNTVNDSEVKLDDIFANESEQIPEVHKEEEDTVVPSEVVDNEPAKEEASQPVNAVETADVDNTVKLDDIFADSGEYSKVEDDNTEKTDIGLSSDAVDTDYSKTTTSLDDMINEGSALKDYSSSSRYTNSLEDFYATDSSLNQDSFAIPSRDVFNDYDGQIDVYDDITSGIGRKDISSYTYPNYNLSSISSSDNIMANVKRVMTGMMKRIRDLEQDFSLERDKSVKLQASRRNLADKNNLLSQEVDAYKNKVGSLDAKLAQASSKMNVLETRVHEQSRVIAAQEQELRVLRPLLTGKDEVVGILADAQALLGESSKVR